MGKRKHRLGPRCGSRLHREASPSLRSKLSALPSVCIGACPGVLERWRRKERTSGGVCEGRQDLLSFQRPGRQNGRRVRINKQTATKGRRISDEALLRCRRACPFERTRIELGTSRPGAKLQQELRNVRLPTV